MDVTSVGWGNQHSFVLSFKISVSTLHSPPYILFPFPFKTAKAIWANRGNRGQIWQATAERGKTYGGRGSILTDSRSETARWKGPWDAGRGRAFGSSDVFWLGMLSKVLAEFSFEKEMEKTIVDSRLWNVRLARGRQKNMSLSDGLCYRTMSQLGCQFPCRGWRNLRPRRPRRKGSGNWPPSAFASLEVEEQVDRAIY